MKKKVKSKKRGSRQTLRASSEEEEEEEEAGERSSRGALGRGRLSFRSQLLGENKGESSECVCV